ncbi:hypothetical protein [Falsarthrobacter nasiphocae]|uniref:Uncharacterized protein n=1 Tax=Falsarthrobacter nasiphocae TaxID=189863 RepID=A0AAE3YGA6_9MICC|nr:hypothetical protein [Falsarthrobacter nasiphocae]MDR6891635.1 hypothetical protein [Falsarthrobacter nasiphocae]
MKNGIAHLVVVLIAVLAGLVVNSKIDGWFTAAGIFMVLLAAALSALREWEHLAVIPLVAAACIGLGSVLQNDSMYSIGLTVWPMAMVVHQLRVENPSAKRRRGSS